MIKAWRLADIGFSVVLGIFMIWYFTDAYSASDSIGNLLLILPVTVAGLLLLILISIWPVFRGFSKTARLSKTEQLRHLMLLGLIAAYIISLHYIYFDLATFVFSFLVTMLVKQGNAVLALVFAAAVTFAIVGAFAWMIPYYPFPTLLS